MNIQSVMKIKQSWGIFTKNHPKFPLFLKAIQKNGIQEGCIIEIKITNPGGQLMETNLKITQEDLQLFENLKGLQP